MSFINNSMGTFSLIFLKNCWSGAYKGVPRDSMFSSKMQLPKSTEEMLANPVSQCFTKRRYNPKPKINQFSDQFLPNCRFANERKPKFCVGHTHKHTKMFSCIFKKQSQVCIKGHHHMPVTASYYFTFHVSSLALPVNWYRRNACRMSKQSISILMKNW